MVISPWFSIIQHLGFFFKNGKEMDHFLSYLARSWEYKENQYCSCRAGSLLGSKCLIDVYCHVEGGVGSGTGRAASPPGAPGKRRSSGSGAGSTGRLTEDTLAYTVRGSDTLTSLAARFDTTPSELVAINKLSSRLIFPGQVYICI